MKLDQILRAVRRYWWQGALLGALLGVAAAVLLSSGPTYKATNTMVYSVAGVDKVADPAEGRIYATSLAGSYSALVTTPLITVPVSSDLGEEAPKPEDLAANLKVLMPDKNLISTLTWVGTDEQQARQIVEAAGTHLNAYVNKTSDKYDGNQRVKIVSQDIVVTPTGPGSSLLGDVLKGLVVATFVALAWILARAILDRKVRSADDVAEISDSSVVGRVRDAGDAEALALAMPYLDDRAEPMVLVTSTHRRENPATTALGLAKGLEAQHPGRVLLVDADLRQGSLSQDAQGVGLSEVLSRQVAFAEAVRPATNGMPALVPAGKLPPNPAELLASGRLLEALREHSADFDAVVVNSAPVDDGSDAAILAAQTGGVLMVVGEGRVDKEDLKDSLDLLGAVRARILGLVLSRR